MTASIARVPKAAQRDNHDLIVVGGGVHGVCLALESARRGLRPLLVERSDFGGATTWNTLRILHGGLRYLQNVDLRRYFESARERNWFLAHFPELVRPLGCLMPLYGRGLYRPAVFRAALAINNLLSRHGNNKLEQFQRLPNGRVLNAAETAERFSAVNRDGLRGGAFWHDAIMLNPQRVLIEILHWACQCGAIALNYVEGKKLLVKGNAVTGLEALDLKTDDMLKFPAPVVVNCAGPWCRRLAESFDRDVPRLFHPSLAFNVLLDRAPLSRFALAVASRRQGARMQFLIPHRGRILAGTYHSSCPHGTTDPKPSRTQIDAFLASLNEAVEGFDLTDRDILRIYPGILPAVSAGSSRQADRSVVYDHGAHGGPDGLFTVSGVKFTTARASAEKALNQIYGKNGKRIPMRPQAKRTTKPCGLNLDEFDLPHGGRLQELRSRLQRLIAEESVVHLDDLVYRRTDWTSRPEDGRQIGNTLFDLLGWDAARRSNEMQRLEGNGSPFIEDGSISAVTR